MRKRYFFLFLLLFFLTTHKTEAIYQPQETANNRFGIHILEKEDITEAAKLVK